MPRTYTVDPPKVDEGLIDAIPAFLEYFRKLDKPTTRASIDRWRKQGYPVRRGGDRVKLPVIYHGSSGRPKTSTAAITRFQRRVKELSGG